MHIYILYDVFKKKTLLLVFWITLEEKSRKIMSKPGKLHLMLKFR